MNLIGALQHLASEGGEVAQAAIKYIQHGPNSVNPKEQPPKTNRKALEEEIGDVFALAELLIEMGAIRRDKITKRWDAKLKTYRRKYA
ncbi:nucleoside triphosphate pyrophosphohydrolase [Ralstonia phage RS-PI-1]|uniref:Uncharacterized protein n=1 Tax=Ralstonia phage RS-PI-1 TaxID=1958965 RepID=A0A1S6L1D4_9CAUD|nr:nucleoside triphosphate pyrophosphohydrolase [Ralstonia phage RS-PI-1]AQT27788.1 hypothetical protein [Ralstonia phage RS-PI-1]